MSKLQPALFETKDYRCLGNLNSASVELRLIYCGHENCQAGHLVGPNKRKAFLLHHVLNGNGVLRVAEKEYPLQAGDSFLLFPGEEAWYEADAVTPWSYLWVGFDGMRAQECVAASGFAEGNHVIHWGNTSRLQGLLEQMIDCHKMTFSDSLRRSACLQMFFAELIDAYNLHVPGIEQIEKRQANVQVRQLMAYIANNFSQPIVFDEIARSMGINRCYLSVQFKKSTGISPSEYLIRLRMEKAKSLLKETNYSIKQIAYEVGYTDQFSFTKIFKKRIGESPKQFREGKESLTVRNEKVYSGEAYL